LHTGGKKIADPVQPSKGFFETAIPARAMHQSAILVVDDSDCQRDMCRLYLENAGFRVTCAENGARGLLAAKVERPDLVLLDLRMPVMDGYGMLGRLRADRALADLPVIVVTGEIEADARPRAMACGADDYLEKPFAMADLIGKIRGQLNKQSD